MIKLREIIREEILNEVAIKIGKEYKVWEPGQERWLEGFECLGYDPNEKWYVFRYWEGHGDPLFMYIDKRDYASSVKI